MTIMEQQDIAIAEALKESLLNSLRRSLTRVVATPGPTNKIKSKFTKRWFE